MIEYLILALSFPPHLSQNSLPSPDEGNKWEPLSQLLSSLTGGWIGASLIVFLRGHAAAAEVQSNGTCAVLTRWTEPLHRASGRSGRRLECDFPTEARLEM